MEREKLKRLFTDHPEEVGESYLEHAFFAFRTTLYLLCAALTCFIHAFFPFIFTKRSSKMVATLVRAFKTRKL